MPPNPPEEPSYGYDQHTILPSPTPSASSSGASQNAPNPHRHGPFRDHEAAARNTSQFSHNSHHSDGQASRKSIASDFKGFQPPPAPKVRDAMGNRESYISLFSDYSARIDNVDDMGAQPQHVKLVDDSRSVPRHQIAIDMSDLTSEASSVNYGKLPTIVTTAQKGSPEAKVLPDYSYDTNIEAAVPQRSPRRPKSEIISLGQTQALHKALESTKKAKHRKHKSVALSDDLDDLMKTASNLESLEGEDFYTDDVSSGNNDPRDPAEAVKAATASPEDSVITIVKAREGKNLPPRPSFEHLRRAREVSNALQEKDLYESGIKEPHEAQKPVEPGPVEGRSRLFGLVDPIIGYKGPGVDPYLGPGIQKDFSYKGLTFSDESVNPVTKVQEKIGKEFPKKKLEDDIPHTTEPVIASSSPNPAETGNRDYEPIPAAVETSSISSKLSSDSHLPDQSADATYAQDFNPTPSQTPNPNERHNSTSSFYPDSRKYSAASSYHVKNTTGPATIGVDPKTTNDEDEYYDIGEPVIVHNPARVRSVKDSTTRLPTHKRTKSKSKKVRGSRASRELRPFSYSTLISLLESMNGTIIGEEFSHLNLPVKEKQLIEKIVDSLSRLTLDMVIDENRYEVGIQRLEKALRVLEGFM
ncbi:uncharacterized protein CANTADRAFT_26751 [Suhomyces tanzawaensis NRRL Y-17324]|uniref:Protein NBA1 n=1 Tax=Suhomyces tanzawaensis NRRL Y-17324 TaxID=984487 RepID=A0A1E4SH72_9ASCO|nr:uncharacterized protein CANTADRAFT_26751 [Suhomyces tanzawaensis NRRL Y-17324]ODV78820.1 hypothetical protein CANTADRAFT_26751 [Suhomyces tanzawaensis NRRL Y-17324]